MVGIFRLHHRVSLRFFLSSQSINNNVDIYSFWCGGDLAERGTLAGAKKFMKYALERTLSSAFFSFFVMLFGVKAECCLLMGRRR